MSTEKKPLWHYWQPRYWPTWLGLALLRLIVLLPHRVRMATGRWMGRVIRQLAGSRRNIVSRNLELCFTEMSAGERKKLEIAHFESLGMGIVELGITSWCSAEEICSLVELRGLEHMHKALEQGNGVIMWSGHFACAEICGLPVQLELPPIAAMYRPSDNPLNDQLMRHCRTRGVKELITKDNVRSLLRALKQNRPVWYAADQAYIGKGAVLAPFFGEPAMTNSAISQIAKVSKAVVVPFIPLRQDKGNRCIVEFLPPLENFPSGNPEADAVRLNKLLEKQIRRAPEQYYWVHRRFKGRPESYSDPYSL